MNTPTTQRSLPTAGMNFPPLKEPYEYRADTVSHALSGGDFDRSANVLNDPYLRIQTPKGNFAPNRNFVSATAGPHMDDDLSGMFINEKGAGDWSMGKQEEVVTRRWGGCTGSEPAFVDRQRSAMDASSFMVSSEQSSNNSNKQVGSGGGMQQQNSYPYMNSIGTKEHQGQPSQQKGDGFKTSMTIQHQQSQQQLVHTTSDDIQSHGLMSHHQTKDGDRADGGAKPLATTMHTLPPQQSQAPVAMGPQAAGAVRGAGPQPKGPGNSGGFLHECHLKSSSPPTVDWLSDNYQVAEGVSLPRSTLYAHYMDHCARASVEAVNAASFGKIIRQVFPNLKTRRLGTRGNSKYHYYGIKLKASSVMHPSAIEQIAHQDEAKCVEKRADDKVAVKIESDAASASSASDKQPVVANTHVALANHFPGDLTVLTVAMQGAGVTLNAVNDLRKLYQNHSQQLLDAMVALDFGSVQDMWTAFWERDYKASYDAAFGCTDVVKLIETCDRILYDTALSCIIPDVFRVYPMLTAQSIRGFSKSLEEWCAKCMNGKPSLLVEQKTRTVKSFAHYLRRYTSLNHLAQAARALLGSHFQVQSMVNDLSRVDFASIKEQMEWLCKGRSATLTVWHDDFTRLLKSKVSLEEWVKWLSGIVIAEVGESETDGKDHVELARQFLMQWSFYSSLIIRDLTLRSAQTFGSFHLIRLLFDEYVLYKVEKQLAKITVQPLLGSTLNFANEQRKTMPQDVSVAQPPPSDQVATMPHNDAACDLTRTPSSSTTASTLSLESEDDGVTQKVESTKIDHAAPGSSAGGDADRSKEGDDTSTIAVSIDESRKRRHDATGLMEDEESGKRFKTSSAATALVAM